MKLTQSEREVLLILSQLYGEDTPRWEASVSQDYLEAVVHLLNLHLIEGKYFLYAHKVNQRPLGGSISVAICKLTSLWVGFLVFNKEKSSDIMVRPHD